MPLQGSKGGGVQDKSLAPSALLWPEMVGSKRHSPKLPFSLPPLLCASFPPSGTGGQGVLPENSPALTCLTCEPPGPDLQGGSLTGDGPALILPSAPPSWGGGICGEAGAHKGSPFLKASGLEPLLTRKVGAAGKVGSPGPPLHGPGESASRRRPERWAPLGAGERLGRSPAWGSGCPLRICPFSYLCRGWKLGPAQPPRDTQKCG